METATSHRERFVIAVDWVLRITGVLSFVAVSVLAFDVRDRAECQAGVNQALTVRARNLDNAVTEERNAQRRADDAFAALTSALLKQPPPSVDVRRRLFIELDHALVDQQKARVQADKARAANPPIPEAEKTC